MSEEELEKLASERAEEETETVDDCDYDGCSRSCARDYYYFGFKDGFNKAIEKLRCCENCKHYKPAVTVNETIGNMCEDFENGCNNSEIRPYNKWELSD